MPLSNASDGILQAIASALQLDAAEQAHLVDLTAFGKPSVGIALPPRLARGDRPREYRDGHRRPCWRPRAGAQLHPRHDGQPIPLGSRPVQRALHRRWAEARNTYGCHLLTPARQFWPDWDQAADDITAHLGGLAAPWTAPST